MARAGGLTALAPDATNVCVSGSTSPTRAPRSSAAPRCRPEAGALGAGETVATLSIPVFDFLRRSSKKHHRAASLPDGWEVIVERAVPLAQRLTPAEQRKLATRMATFLEKKGFEGCGGLELTETMRVTIAAHACLLLAGLDGDADSGGDGADGDVFPTVETILVYPHAYRGVQRHRAGPVTIEQEQARAGEAWGGRGPLVLAWDSVERAAVVSEHNVVIHEFAHALDSENGDMDGAPWLPSRERAERWAAVLGGEFTALQAAVGEGRETDIDPYGATNPAEFFAVVTEAFFGTPDMLAEKHADLYAELAAYYALDAYRARVPGPRPPPVRRGWRLPAARPGVVYSLMTAAACVLAVVLRFAWIELVGFRVAGHVQGTATGAPSDVARTGRAEVALDTGPVVTVEGAVGDYPAGTRVTVQVRKSPILGRTSYTFTLPEEDGPTLDRDLTLRR